LPQLEELILENQKISLLIEFDDFKGLDFEAVKDDLLFSRQHNKDFEKVAIVGDKKWLKWMTLVSNPFLKGEIKYFEKSNFHMAWDWLRIPELTHDDLAEAPIDRYKKIMVGIDFSPYSKHAAKRALQLSEQTSAEIVLVNVIDESSLYEIYYGPVTMGLFTGLSQDFMTKVDEYISQSKEQMDLLLNELGLEKNQGVVLTGRPSTTLNSYAEAQKVDLIIMGSKSKRGMEAIMNSSTRYLLSNSRSEILAVPLIE